MVPSQATPSTHTHALMPDLNVAAFNTSLVSILQVNAITAAAVSIIINALAIETEPTFGLGTLSGYFEDHLITGEGSFALAAADFDAFGDAIAQKLLREIIPVPAAVYLFASGLIALGAIGRRKMK